MFPPSTALLPVWCAQGCVSVGECRRHFRHGSSPQILTQLLELTPMGSYLYLLRCHGWVSLPSSGLQSVAMKLRRNPKISLSASRIFSDINVVASLQNKGATLSLQSVLSQHMPSCSFSPSSPPT